ncbi:MAG: carboxypeptidase regulatory-like domain-containing protein [Terriglobales bacterium]
MRARIRIFISAVLSLLLVSSLFGAVPEQKAGAASAKTSISGTVTDRTGNVLAGAKVVLDGPDKREAQSAANGSYSFTGLKPGQYTLTVSFPNFPQQVYSDIYLKVGTELPIDVALEGTAASAAASEQPAQSQQEQLTQQPQSTIPLLPPPSVVMPVLAGQEQSGKAGGGNGIISGIVTDQQGAVVGGANLTLAGPGNFKANAVSLANGSYVFANLAPGTYTLTITAANFAQKVFADINLTAGASVPPLDVSLELPSTTEQVNVESSSPGTVETENATVSGTIEQKEVVGLQLNGRNFSQLIALAPGVSNQTGQDEGKVGVVGSVKYSVNGGRVEYNSFEIDGSDVLNTGLNRSASALVVYPSIDAIQEVKVLTSNYGAQYGRTASGTVQVTTKSGTSSFHGGVYDFTRNEAFNARNYFDFTSKAPLYRRQDFGGTIGGPLTIPGVYNTKKDRTFFFFSEEARLEKSPIDYNQAVPGLKERGLIMTANGIQENLGVNPNASGQVAQIFDFTDVCPPSGSGSTFNRQQYPDCPSSGGSTQAEQAAYYLEGAPPGQSVPFGVDKNALVILNANLFPLPNSATGCNYALPVTTVLQPDDPYRCYLASVSPSTYWREELFRIDHNLTQKLKLGFRYIHDAWDTTVLAPQWSYLSITNPAAATFPTIQNRFVGPGLILVASLTHTISPTVVNSIVVSYVNSTITLADRNGPGGAQFQRNPALDQPLVSGSQPGCNPTLSVDPATLLPECAIGSIFNNGFGGKMPGVAILGTNAAYGGRGFAEDPSYMPWEHSNPTFSARDDVGKQVGRHTLTFGAEYVLYQRNQDNNVIGGASGDLQGLITYSNLANSTGNAFADFLAQQAFGSRPDAKGFIQSFTQDSAQHRYYQRYQLAEPYFQDDWKITHRLTLNLGMRLSLFGTYSEKNHAAWNWEASRFDPARFTVDPSSGILLDSGNPVTFAANTFALDPSVVSGLGLVQCGVGGVAAACMSGHLFNWAPRIGFAWDPKGDAKTSIRGGYGVFFEHGTGNEANTGSLEASAPVVLSVTQPNPYSLMCIGNAGFGTTFNQQIGSGNYCGGSTPPANSLYPIDVTSIPTHAVWPYVQQWSFGIQHELLRDFVINLAYAGSKGTHLTVERQLNQLPPLPASENPFGPNEPLTLNDCTVPIPGSSAADHPGSGSIPFQLESGVVVEPTSPAYQYLQAACTNPDIPNVNSLPGRPYPGLGRVLSLQNVANSSYHAFQFTGRRTRGALTTGLSYSYSHSIDDSSDRSDPVLVNSYDLRENRASSNFDERHLLTFNYIYQFSFRGIVRNLSDWANEKASKNAQDKTSSASHSGFGQRIADGWEFSGITLFHSGTPFSVINTAGNTGISVTDNAGVSSNLGIAASYPDVVRGIGQPANNLQSFGPLLANPSQFVAPRGLTFGDAGRNFLNNPHQINFDMALAKHFRITEASQLEFRTEAFNIFNHTEFRIYDPDNPGGTGNNVISCYAGPANSAGYKGSAADCVTGASFLHPLDAHRSRTLQLALKLSF